MSILPKSAYEFDLPEMIPVTQLFPDDHIENVYEETRKTLDDQHIKKRIRPGQSVAVAVGSRGIQHIDIIVKATVDYLKEAGTIPFIFPAMGSHGGGIAENQKNILEGYGVSEAKMGVPIVSSMDTAVIGYTSGGVPVHMDRHAYDADALVLVARVKPHTDFKGPIESGLCKMMAIGCGKQTGCNILHKEGIEAFPTLIPEVGEIYIKNKNVAFGVAVVENAHEHVHTIKAIPGDKILEEEPKLLNLSKSLMPRLYFDSIDVLVVEEIGKDITGMGMDPNIMGRLSDRPAPGYTGPQIQRIVVLGLTEATHGNASGISAADYITKKVFDEIDFEATFTNAIASCDNRCGFIPVFLDNEELAMRAAIQTCLRVGPDQVKIVRIKNTLQLSDIFVSKNLFEYCVTSDKFKVDFSSAAK